MPTRIERLREWCDAVTQETAPSTELIEAISEWKYSNDGLADALAGLRDPSFPHHRLCLSIIAVHQRRDLPQVALRAVLQTLLASFRVVSTEDLPSAGAIWISLITDALSNFDELGRNARCAGLKLANSFLTAGNWQRGCAILNYCLDPVPWNFTDDESDLITRMIIANIEMPNPPRIVAMLDAIRPAWLGMNLITEHGERPLFMSRERGDLRPIIVHWAFTVLESAVEAAALSDDDLDITARVASGLGGLCRSIGNRGGRDPEFAAEHDGRLCSLMFELVLKYPDNADLSHAFVSQVVPLNRAWPADAMPLLVAHLLRFGLLSDEDVRLAGENAMDYWWIALEPEPHDKGLRAVSLSLFQTEARMDFAVVREAFLQQIENIGDDLRVAEVVMRYIAAFLEIQREHDDEDPRLVEVAMALIQAVIEVDALPIACACRYLLAPVIVATRNPEMIQLAEQAAYEWLIVGDDEIAKLRVTVAFTIVNALCDVDAVTERIAGGVIACADLCLTSICGSILAYLAEMEIGNERAAIFAEEVISDLEEFAGSDLDDDDHGTWRREQAIRDRAIERLCLLWTKDGCAADVELLGRLAAVVIPDERGILVESTYFTVFGAVLTQVGPNHELGRRCLQTMAERIAAQRFFIPDFITAILPTLKRDWRVIPISFILDVIRLRERDELLDFHEESIITYFTFVCRVIWGSRAAIVQVWTKEQLANLAWLAALDESDGDQISHHMLEILEMETVLTRVAAGIVDEDRIVVILRNLPRTAISDYHRLLAVSALGPLLVQSAELAASFGPMLQAILENRLDPTAVGQLRSLPQWELFDELPAVIPPFAVEGFVQGAGPA
jgi:hypothetical protein